MNRLLPLLILPGACLGTPAPVPEPPADDDDAATDDDDGSDDDDSAGGEDDDGWGAIYAAAVPISVVVTVLDEGGAPVASFTGSDLVVPAAVGQSISIVLDAALVQGTSTRPGPEGSRDAARARIGFPASGPLVLGVERPGSLRHDLCVVEVPFCGIGVASTTVVVEGS